MRHPAATPSTSRVCQRGSVPSSPEKVMARKLASTALLWGRVKSEKPEGCNRPLNHVKKRGWVDPDPNQQDCQRRKNVASGP